MEKQTETTFFARVYAAVRQVPRGKVTTYGDIARCLGAPRSARVVGYALHANPEPILTPCHRVVNREGRLAPAFAFGGSEVQKSLLESEGVFLDGDGRVDLSVYRFPLCQAKPTSNKED